ncbi:MAG: site-specific integrase [Verrucomicrobia bacterium]|jgi:integrase|nr:site-specific integrase [Verrucomicrobiota bacterium]
MTKPPKGRPRKNSEFDVFYGSLPSVMTKRAKYLKGIGVFKGSTGDTVWIKIRLPKGGVYKGKSYSPGSSLEIKMGNRASWSWQQLIDQHADMQGKADRGEALEDEVPPTFGEWSALWLARLKVRAKSSDTSDSHLRVHILPEFGGQLLTNIGVTEINSWIMKRLGDAAPGTVKRQFNTLRSIFSDAVKAGKLEKNPCENADTIRGVATRSRFLSIEELVELVARAADLDEWFSDYVLWCVHTGMRRGEVLDLHWSSVNKVSDTKSIVVIETSKADKPRIVSCTPTMMKILERQKTRQKDNDARVFPIALSTLRRRWAKVLVDAGLQNVWIHDLRRTHATHIVASGVDLNTIAGRIGHADLTMLQKHYAALTDSAEQGMVDMIEGVFGNGRANVPEGVARAK